MEKSISKTIYFGGIEIEIVKKRMRNTRIVISPDGRVRVSTSLRTSDEDIQKLLDSKYEWIRTHRQRYLLRERESIEKYLDGEVGMFLGNRYTLKIVENTGIDEISIKEGKYIEMFTKYESVSSKNKKIYLDWQKNELTKILREYVHKWESITGLKVEEWTIRKMRTRWGSCNTRSRKIIFNLDLIKKKPEFIEYVVLHEIVHIKIPNHGSTFKAMLDKYIPTWRDIRKEANGKKVT
jgi:predicted metal-dependent hydrolase